jgi:hypothetical protein
MILKKKKTFATPPYLLKEENFTEAQGKTTGITLA